MTAFDRIEKLKQDYTDKYVVVDRSRPELMRFRQRTGQVKTVNMSGRALVEFSGHNDIGWYDIEIDFLKVVDKPDESDSKPTAKKAPKKPIAEKEPSSLEKARAEKTATAKAGGKPKMSTADILAAARAKKQGGATAPTTEKDHTEKDHAAKDSTEKAAAPKKKSGKMSTADILAAARAGKSGGPSPAASESRPADKPAPQASAAKTDRSKMSTTDILAAARAAKASTQESAESAATASETESPVAEKPETEKPVAEKQAEEQTASVESSTPASAPAGDLPTDTAGIIAYCRQNGGS